MLIDESLQSAITLISSFRRAGNSGYKVFAAESLHWPLTAFACAYGTNQILNIWI
jgi:hypothetical protein